MKARIVFELPLPEGFEPYLDIIAKVHGYEADEFPDMTAAKYLLQKICTEAVSKMFEALIVNGLTAYYGLSGVEQINQIRAQYNDIHTITADIVDA